MIGKPEWFTYRKFGWGISPKKWQGWIYIAIIALAIGFTMSLSITDSSRIWLFGIVFGVILLDMIHIMTQLPKVHDERENLHQLIIERNCSFAAIFALAAIALYQTYLNKGIPQNGIFPFDYSIMIVLGIMVLTKVISTIYVNTKI